MNCTLYAPESFEYLILSAGIVDVPKGILQETYLYADSKAYMSWEEFVGEETYDSEDKRKNSFKINNDSPSKRGGNRIENVQTHIAPNIGHKEGKTSKNA